MSDNSGDWVDVWKVDPTHWIAPGAPATVHDLVEDQFETMNGYALDFIRDAQTKLDDLADLLKSFDFPEWDIDYTQIIGGIRDILEYLASLRPNVPPLAVEAVADPTEPNLVDPHDPDIPDVPSLTAVAPAVTYPDPPSDAFPTAPGDPPDITLPDTIPAPVYAEPTLPALEDLPIPAAPEAITNPTFEAERPNLDITLPGSLFNYHEDVYQSDLLDAAKAKLLTDVQNGGTGLGADVEDAIWDRGRTRLLDEHLANYDTIMEQNVGFDLPAGALAARIDEEEDRYQRELTNLNNDIAIKQAELAQANTHFTLSETTKFENLLIGHFDTVQQRSLEAAKMQAQAAIDLYNMHISIFNAKLTARQIEAAVFEALIRAANLELEKYKARLEGTKLAVEIQNQKLEKYKAQWDGIRTQVAVYSERIKAQSYQIEIERLKIERHRSLIEIYNSRLKALLAKYDVWKSQLEGEGLKVDVYGKQVNAYGHQVSAIRTMADLEQIKTNIDIAKNRDQIDIFKSRIEKYRADVTRVIERLNANVKLWGLDVERYRADVQAAGAQLNGDVAELQAKISHAENLTKLQIEEVRLMLDALLREYKFKVDGLLGIMNAHTQLAASSMNAVQASAGLASNYYDNVNYSEQYQQSVSNQAGITEYHQYNETSTGTTGGD